MLGVAVIPATQATHPSISSKLTSIYVSISTSTRGSFLSNSSSSTVRAPNLEETSTNVRITMQLAFLPHHPTRMAKQLQCKSEVVHASTVENKTTGQRTVQRKQLSSRQQSIHQQDKERHSKHPEAVVRPTTMGR
jgi:hypothetical protein